MAGSAILRLGLYSVVCGGPWGGSPTVGAACRQPGPRCAGASGGGTAGCALGDGCCGAAGRGRAAADAALGRGVSHLPALGRCCCRQPVLRVCSPPLIMRHDLPVNDLHEALAMQVPNVSVAGQLTLHAMPRRVLMVMMARREIFRDPLQSMCMASSQHAVPDHGRQVRVQLAELLGAPALTPQHPLFGTAAAALRFCLEDGLSRLPPPAQQQQHPRPAQPHMQAAARRPAQPVAARPSAHPPPPPHPAAPGAPRPPGSPPAAGGHAGRALGAGQLDRLAAQLHAVQGWVGSDVLQLCCAPLARAAADVEVGPSCGPAVRGTCCWDRPWSAPPREAHHSGLHPPTSTAVPCHLVLRSDFNSSHQSVGGHTAALTSRTAPLCCAGVRSRRQEGSWQRLTASCHPGCPCPAAGPWRPSPCTAAAPLGRRGWWRQAAPARSLPGRPQRT